MRSQESVLAFLDGPMLSLLSSHSDPCACAYCVGFGETTVNPNIKVFQNTCSRRQAGIDYTFGCLSESHITASTLHINRPLWWRQGDGIEEAVYAGMHCNLYMLAPQGLIHTSLTDMSFL